MSSVRNQLAQSTSPSFSHPYPNRGQPCESPDRVGFDVDSNSAHNNGIA